MGKSYTYNIIGVGKPFIGPDGETRQRLISCMNKTDMVQEMMKLLKEGHNIDSWYAQTATGAKTLGTIFPYQSIEHDEIKDKLPKLMECPICKGIGTKHLGENIIYQCPVCNGSGVTRNGCWGKWQEWQLDMFRAKFTESEPIQ